MGVGLLNFQETPGSEKIFRHVMTQGASVKVRYFNEKMELQVSPNNESKPQPQLETDSIIDLPQFDQNNVIDAEKAAITFINDDANEISTVFDNKIHDALRIFSQTINEGDSDYIKQLEKPKEDDTTPKVYFSPALLLRKRNTKSLSALYENILGQIDNTDDDFDVPSINDLIDNDGGINHAVHNDNILKETTYFPLPYNDEQIQIIEKSRRSNKVLVQGPPGTGKSHTIANLMCHLLANGNRVLVTAYTQRALEVLKGKLPEEFQDLTVSLLGGDSSSIQGLDKSVNTISGKAANTNLTEYQEDIEKFEKLLSKAREQQAFNTNELIKIKEKSTRQQKINAYYQGTLLDIAEQLEADSETFEWYKDSFCNIDNNDVISDLASFIEFSTEYSQADVRELNYIIPEKNQLPTATHLYEYKRNLNQLEVLLDSTGERVTIYSADYISLATKLQNLADCYIQASTIRNSIAQKLVNPYLQGDSNQFREKLKLASIVLSQIESIDLKQVDSDIEITYISENSIKQLKKDVGILLKYLKKGNALQGFLFTLKKPFLSAQIKGRLYLIGGVKVNGSPCDTKEEFEDVLRDIELQQGFNDISKTLWNIDLSQKTAYQDKFQYFKTFISDTTKLFTLIDESEVLRASINTSSSIQIEAFDRKKIIWLIQEVEYSDLTKKTSEFETVLQQTKDYLKQDNIHSIAKEILDDIENINVNSYNNRVEELEGVVDQQIRYLSFKRLKKDLIDLLPELTANILANEFRQSDIQHFPQAVCFRHAQNEVNQLLDIDYEATTTNALIKSEQKERDLITKIASNKAWLHVLQRLEKNNSLSKHLKAFAKAVKKIGKTGVGRRAKRFIEIAQNEMRECKSAVPCWIMPLYKVIESIQPEQGMYDYVIIDEASQLGGDAIFLLFIAKNIIIVGDDKQTSPEYIGLQDNAMSPYIKQHLKGIPFSAFYGTEFSFFDHADLFCEGKIVLREHFRCMPEIIEFCNENFYKHDGIGLYPLKQYSQDRLDPLQNIYCQNGNVDGNGSSIINEPEAKRLVEEIAKCVKDNRYDKKTFGVIALQGHKQAEIIEALLLKKIGESEFNKRNIVCGNSTSFQGDERDIIFLSLVTAHNHNRSALTKPVDERRFNVAVSRAKEQIWLFHSVQMEDLRNPNDLRYKLLNHFKNYRVDPVIGINTIPIPPTRPRPKDELKKPFESWFEVDVYNDIILKGYSVIAQYNIANGRYFIDLVLILPNGTKIAVECDGDKWHPASQYEKDMMRQRDLERSGWQFFRVRGSTYYANRKKALEPLWEMLPDLTVDSPVPVEKERADAEPDAPIPPSNKSKPRLKPSEGQGDIFGGADVVTPLIDEDTQRTRTRSRQEATTNQRGEFLIFTNHFNVYKLKDTGFTKPQALEKIKIKFDQGEKQVYKTILVKDYSEFLIIAFENGKLAKVSLSDYATKQNTSRLINAYDDSSKLISIEHFKTETDLVATSSAGKVLVFNTKEILAKGRKAQGIKVMKLTNNSKLTKVKKLSGVSFLNPEYYRCKKLGGVGNNLSKGDAL